VLETIDLSGPWKFSPDPFNNGEPAKYFAEDHDTSGWIDTEVPTCFDTILPDLWGYEGWGWFTRTVIVPDNWKGRRIILRFEAVNYHARVWLNGVLIGENVDGFLPFEFPVHKHLRHNESNVLTVLVDNCRKQGEVPGFETGWRPFGGILRKIYLISSDHLRIDNVVLHAEPSKAGGRLSVQAQVTNDRPKTLQPTIVVTITDRDDRVIGRLQSQTVNVDCESSATYTSEETISNAKSWSPDTPNLYTAHIELTLGDTLVDTLDLRFGFRRIETDGTKLLLNGRPLFLTGFNRHEDSPTANMCTDTETARKDFLAMKNAGANFVRLAHYPHSSEELDLCDELGLLVMDEIPLYWWCWDENEKELCTVKLETAKRQLQRMIERDRNHPSVIFWSVSNENNEDVPEVCRGNEELIRFARSLDSSRLAVHVSFHWYMRHSFAEDDVICLNAYPSWEHGYMERKPNYDLAQSKRFWEEKLENLHNLYPDKPILIAEFGFQSIEGVSDGPLGTNTHADVLAAEFSAFTADYLCGATVWCWADHPWPEIRGTSARLHTSPMGVVTRDRHPLPAFEKMKTLFRERRSGRP